MADVVTRLVVESKEYDSKIARATSGLTQFEKKCREVGGTLEFVEKEDLEFVKALGQMETVSSSAVGSLSELKKAFTELSVQYQNLTDAEKQSPYGQALAGSLDQIKGRIGDLSGQLSNAQGELNISGTAFEKFAGKMGLSKEALGQVGQAMGQLGPVASGLGRVMTGALGPVGIAIAAIVAAIKQLVDAFKRNEDAMKSVQKIAAPFKAIWQSIQRLFDDIVRIFQDVYTNLEKAAGGFSGFKMALAPVAAVIAAVRASLAILGTLLTDIAKGVAYVADKVRGAMQGSTVGKFFQNITDTVQGFFTKFTGWVEKIANSKLGKKLGLDSLHTQLKEIIHAQDELTASNQRIAQSENELNKLRRRNNEQTALDERRIAQLRAEASEKDKYTAAERVKKLEEAADLEERIMKRDVTLKQKELDLIKLKNSLTQSGTEDLDAQSAAQVALTNVTTAYYNKQRALQRQLQAAKKEDAKDQAAASGGDVTTPQPKPIKDAVAMWKEYEEKIADVKARLEEFKAMVTDTSLTDAQREWAAGMADSYQEQLDKMTGATQEAVDEMKTKVEELPSSFEMMRESLSNLSSGVGAISTIGNAFNELKGIGEDLASAFSGEMDAWDSLMTVFNSGVGIMQTVIGVMEAINTLQELSAALSKKKVVEQTAETTAVVSGKGAEAAAESAEAAASGTATAANTAEAAAGAGKAMAGIPIVGPVLAVAAIAAVLAAVLAATSKAKSAGNFAIGGVVGGNSFSGDNMIAHVNSGETILTAAQSDTLARNMMGSPMGAIQVEGRISGKDILLSANNTNRAAGGSRGYYTKVK